MGVHYNPYLQTNKENIDCEFWQINIGEEYIRHRLLVKKAINKIMQAQPSQLPDLAAGYQKGKSNWDNFWDNNYRLAVGK